MENIFSVDDFLSKKIAQKPFLATLAKVEDDDNKILIKQFFDKSESCSCDSSFEIDKKLIKEVKLTGLTRRCCDNNYDVVEVIFIDNFSLDFNGFISIVQKLTRGINKQREHLVNNFSQVNEKNEGNCRPGMLQCNPNNPYDCYDPKHSFCCYNSFKNQYRIVIKNGNF